MGLRIINRVRHDPAEAFRFAQEREALLKVASEFWTNSVGASSTNNEADFMIKMTAMREAIPNQADADATVGEVTGKIREQQERSLRILAHLDFETLAKLVQ